jgi:hypothetical protein
MLDFYPSVHVQLSYLHKSQRVLGLRAALGSYHRSPAWRADPAIICPGWRWSPLGLGRGLLGPMKPRRRLFCAYAQI